MRQGGGRVRWDREVRQGGGRVRWDREVFSPVGRVSRRRDHARRSRLAQARRRDLARRELAGRPLGWGRRDLGFTDDLPLTLSLFSGVVVALSLSFSFSVFQRKTQFEGKIHMEIIFRVGRGCFTVNASSFPFDQNFRCCQTPANTENVFRNWFTVKTNAP